MKKIVFIQGGGNGGYEADKKLVYSLKNCLGNDYEINYPEIQSKESESDYGWTKQIGQEISGSEDNFILVGHSFGASMILKYLSENSVQKKIKGIFLISTPFWSGNEDWMKGLILKDNFADKLPDNVPMFFYHAKDDEEIPFSQFNNYQKKINRANYREIDHGGHQLNNDLSIVAKDIKDL
jgi:predicted alpha/beta hydrolase family esterase